MRLKLLILTIAMAVLCSCRTVKNFEDKNKPVWEQRDRVVNNLTLDSTLTVISYNIEFSLQIDQAISDLQKADLVNSDVILLQEMDEIGTKVIAERLDYNYVYFPLSIHPKRKKYFGNAILSKWPIVRSEKIILSHEQPQNQLKRGATSAVIQYGSIQILVYSIHMETFVMSQQKRLDQLRSALDHIKKEQNIEHVIFGGDFNSMLPSDTKKMVSLSKDYELDWASKDVGHTVKVLLIVKRTIDHIFSKKFKLLDSGKLEESNSSDHLPIWVRLKLN